MVGWRRTCDSVVTVSKLLSKIVLFHKEKNTCLIGFNQFLFQFENGFKFWF